MEIVLTPRGALRVDAGELASTSSQPLQAGIVEAFGRGAGHGLLYLGANTVGIPLPPSLAFWRDVAVRYVTAVCAGGIDAAAALIPAAELATLIAAAPLMLGNEYLSVAILECLWGELAAALGAELAESGGSLQDFLKERHPAWNLVGRVHFNLAENRKDESAPFAFIATYTSRLSAHAKAQHQPLGAALQEYADGKSHARLLALLLPVQRAAEQCPWLRSMVDTGEIYHPLRWTPGDALQLLMDLPKLEAAGVVVRTPATWPGGRPARAQVQGRLGARPPSQLGAEALLDFSVDVTLQGQTLSAAEIKRLLAASEGLQLIRGHWVEVDRQALTRLLERFQGLAREAAEGLPFAQAMALVALSLFSLSTA